MWKKNFKVIAYFLLIIIFAITFSNCSTKVKERGRTPEVSDWRVGGRYYFFDDVLVCLLYTSPSPRD